MINKPFELLMLYGVRVMLKKLYYYKQVMGLPWRLDDLSCMPNQDSGGGLQTPSSHHWRNSIGARYLV